MTFATASDSWIKLIRKNWLYLRLPKLGVVKVRMHRTIPDAKCATGILPGGHFRGFVVKQVSVTKKADGWFIQLVLEDVKSAGRNLPSGELHVNVPT